MILRNENRVRRHIALIAGGSKGIGRAGADALAAAGWHVALLARTDADLRRAVEETRARFGEDSASCVVADATNTAQVESAVVSVENEVGPIDLLVNSVGQNE